VDREPEASGAAEYNFTGGERGRHAARQGLPATIHASPAISTSSDIIVRRGALSAKLDDGDQVGRERRVSGQQLPSARVARGCGDQRVGDVAGREVPRTSRP
jgi:hypothetical protein